MLDRPLYSVVMFYLTTDYVYFTTFLVHLPSLLTSIHSLSDDPFPFLTKTLFGKICFHEGKSGLSGQTTKTLIYKVTRSVPFAYSLPCLHPPKSLNTYRKDQGRIPVPTFTLTLPSNPTVVLL